MVYRIFVEKKPGQTHEADNLFRDVREFLQIQSLESAIKEAYRLSDGVQFEGAYRRSDIGQRALQALK